ncbi:hypothetical protein CsSME_00039242 [Camellia sinensis var. sinensis]
MVTNGLGRLSPLTIGPTDQVLQTDVWAEADGLGCSQIRGSTALLNKGLNKKINSRKKDDNNWNRKGKGKIQSQKKGFFDLVSRYGFKGASSSKQVSKQSVLRGSVAEASISASIDSGNAAGRRILSDAQATVQIGALLGLQYIGKEAEVINKIVELERKDKERIGRVNGPDA